MKAHLGADVFQGPHLKVSPAHPQLDGAERVFDRLPPDTHAVGREIQAALHVLKDLFMLPAGDAPLLAWRALFLEGALGAVRTPVAVLGQFLRYGRVPPDQGLSSRAAVFVLLRIVDEVVPPEAPDEHAIAIAPGPPPPARVEAIPAPPSEAVYWVPGHWRWYGTADGHSGWAWTAGYYAERPSHTAVWIDGHWQQSSAGYVWVEGYWR